MTGTFDEPSTVVVAEKQNFGLEPEPRGSADRTSNCSSER